MIRVAIALIEKVCMIGSEYKKRITCNTYRYCTHIYYRQNMNTALLLKKTLQWCFSTSIFI